jgi:hypothetical protein
MGAAAAAVHSSLLTAWSALDASLTWLSPLRRCRKMMARLLHLMLLIGRQTHELQLMEAQ